MQETRLRSRYPGFWFVVLTLLLAFTVGCASWFSDGAPGGGIDPVDPTFIGGITPSDTTPDAGQAVTLGVNATDPQGQALTYVWDDGNTGAGDFTGTGASVTWSSAVAGTYTITVTVTDPDGNSDTTTFTIVVADDPIPGNNAPTFADPLAGDVTAPVATQTIKFSGMATDADGDPLTYSWIADGAGAFTDEAVGDDGVASAFWAADAAGTFTVTLTADDGQGGVATVSATVGVSTDPFSVEMLPTEFAYAGYETCQNCHSAIADTWMATGHNTIEDNIQMFGLGRIESCRECHDTGYQAGGFISIETTPQFKNVQCEACHGPYDGGAGGGHMPVSLDPALCGACHTDAHHPTYDEWEVSGHALVDLESHQATSSSCVRCHTGDWYIEVIVNGGDPPAENLDPLVNPGMPIVCATCHDPHDSTNANQLRISSEGTINLAFEDTPVSAGKGNLCISCHDGKRTLGDREGHVENGSGHFGPHSNAQGPVLFGVSGIEFAGYPVATDHTHSTVENTCVSCHMRAKDFEDEAPAITGHSFEPVFEACADCHGDVPTVTGLMDTYHAEIEGLLADFVAAWPAAWRTQDPETLEWDLENRDTDPATGVGPPRGLGVGSDFREALWNYYLIVDDGSHGVHNPAYVRDLLNGSISRLGELEAPIVTAAQTGYVGKDTCLGCHSGVVDGALFDTHRHNHKLNPATSEFIGAWWTGSHVFDTINYDFGIDGETYVATIDGVDHEIIRTLGWGFEKWKQRYIVKVGNSWYITPAQHNMVTDEWVNYHTSDWDAGMPASTTASYDRRCTGCHTTGNNVEFYPETGEWVSGVAEENVQCEACHGPGEVHADSMNAADIINPDTDITDYVRQIEVCGTCHGRGSSVAVLGESTMGYPFGADGMNFRPGDTLSDFYTQTVAESNFWQDGPGGTNYHAKSHHEQYNEFQFSEHYAAEITCWTCHNVHEPDADVTNDLCMGCHAADVPDLNLHTKHATAKLCVDCHMPYTAKSAVAYDVRSHIFEIITPQTTMDMLLLTPDKVIPNSCMNGGCHGGPDAITDEALVQARVDAYNLLWPPL